MDFVKEVERSIITKYRKKIYRPFVKGISDYQMIKENDKIAVCISGGKDSFLLAKSLQELQRHGNVKFDLEYIVMNPGYTEKHLNQIKDNAKKLEIDIIVFDTDVFEVSMKLDNEKPCYMCARMRRGCLYNKAIELGCNKIALGHHYDDVIETILLSVLYGGEFKTMMPKLKSTNFANMELIRPLYLVRESDIISWKNYHDLTFLNCACKFTEKSELEDNSKRKEIKALISQLEDKSKYITGNIFKSVEKVNLNTIISYQKNNETCHFLDEYDN